MQCASEQCIVLQVFSVRKGSRSWAHLHARTQATCTTRSQPTHNLHTHQVGIPADEIAERLRILSATEPDTDFTIVPPLPRPVLGVTLKLHCPPRTSKKVGDGCWWVWLLVCLVACVSMPAAHQPKGGVLPWCRLCTVRPLCAPSPSRELCTTRCISKPPPCTTPPR